MKIDENEKKFWLRSDSGIIPYLRMNEGMPKGKVKQIAWLLLNGSSGCGFCKVCRDEPCGIALGETCSDNIADYIRKMVENENFQNGKDWINLVKRLPDHPDDDVHGIWYDGERIRCRSYEQAEMIAEFLDALCFGEPMVSGHYNDKGIVVGDYCVIVD